MSDGVPIVWKRTQPPRPPKRPTYYAFETRERNVWRCYPAGPRLRSRAQLEAWARGAGVELRFVGQRSETGPTGPDGGSP